MKEYSSASIRNVALVSHSSAGKTILTEAFLHFTGATTRMGKIEDKTSVSDFDEEEHRRSISLYSTVIPLEYRDKKINVLDTPGYTDFVGEVISALRVVEGVVVLLDSVAGLEVGTEIAWSLCDKLKLPRIVVVNKMERENANFSKTLESMNEFSDTRLIPVQLPWGEKQDFKGVLDLISMKAYKGVGTTAEAIPAEYKDAVDIARLTMIEAAAEGEDALMEKYFENGDLTTDEIIQGIKDGMVSGKLAPAFVSSALTEIGIAPLLNAIISLFPSPVDSPKAVAKGKNGDEVLACSDTGPLAAYVWKTTADPYVGKQTYFKVVSGVMHADSRAWNPNKGVEERYGSLFVPRGKENIPTKIIHFGDIGCVAKLSETSTCNTLCDKGYPITLPIPEYPNSLYRVAILPKTLADSTKISPTLTRLCEEDMTLTWSMEAATNQTVLQGMGDQHIDVVIRRAATKFQVHLVTEDPKVPYQETITGKGDAMYRHRKQTGGSGQFGEVWLKVEPLVDGEFELVNEVVGGAISSSYIPAIEKGIRSILKEGVIAGYPVHAVRVAVYDGKEHAVDSKPIAFEIAGREAFKLAFKDANPVLYEPIMNVRIIVPESNMGDVLGDLNTRRARVQGMESEKGRSIVSATVPLAEMLRYTTQLRSVTGGRGIFTLEFSHYEVVPNHITQTIVAARLKEIASKKEE